jgi:hypothetical protein
MATWQDMMPNMNLHFSSYTMVRNLIWLPNAYAPSIQTNETVSTNFKIVQESLKMSVFHRIMGGELLILWYLSHHHILCLTESLSLNIVHQVALFLAVLDHVFSDGGVAAHGQMAIFAKLSTSFLCHKASNSRRTFSYAQQLA